MVHRTREILALVGVAVALVAAFPAAVAADDRRTAEVAEDVFPLAPRDGPTELTQATSTVDGDGAQLALAVALAMLGGGVAAWFAAGRAPRVTPVAMAVPSPVRLHAEQSPPPLWSGAVMADPPAPLPAPAPGAPAPPDPERAWTAEIAWHLVEGGAQFRAETGEEEPAAVAVSPVLTWPPNGARSGAALTEAVEAIEAALVGAGWTQLPRGGAWYARRFSWRPGAQPPAPATGRTRHRELFDAAYARQADRTRRLRRSIAERLLPDKGHD